MKRHVERHNKNPLDNTKDKVEAALMMLPPAGCCGAQQLYLRDWGSYALHATTLRGCCLGWCCDGCNLNEDVRRANEAIDGQPAMTSLFLGSLLRMFAPSCKAAYRKHCAPLIPA